MYILEQALRALYRHYSLQALQTPYILCRLTDCRLEALGGARLEWQKGSTPRVAEDALGGARLEWQKEHALEARLESHLR